MATYPGWAALDYNQRMGLVQSGKADMQGNNLAVTIPQSPNLKGAGAGSSITRDATGRESTTVTPDLAPRQHQYDIEEQNNAAKINSDQMRLQAQLEADAAAKRGESVRSLIGTVGPTPEHVSTSGAPVDDGAAQAAALARAKDAAGQNALAQLRTLEDVMSERGQRGSSVESNLTGDILTGTGRQMADFITQGMVNTSNRAAQVADRNYAGDITQRGQDLSRQASLLGLLQATGGLY